MSDEITDMEVALWAWLEADPAWAALGLKTWKGYDGALLPHDPDGLLFPDNALPALSGVAMDLGSERVTETQMIDAVGIEFMIVVGTTSADRSRSTIGNIWKVIRNRLHTWQAQTGGLGGGIASLRWETDAPKPVTHKDDRSTPLFWLWPFKVFLTGNERLSLG